MADGLDFSDILQRTVQANARFYQGWINLTLEYFRGVSEIFGLERPAPAQPAPEPDAGTGVVVLEAEAGQLAHGAFLVSNDLGRKLSCKLYSSGFTAPDGTGRRLKVSFDPAGFELAPGEQRVVQAAVTIDGKLEPGAPYTGHFAIGGLDGFSVPAVVRRQHAVEESPIDREASAEPTAPARSRPGSGGRNARGSAASRRKPAASPRKRTPRQ